MTENNENQPTVPTFVSTGYTPDLVTRLSILSATVMDIYQDTTAQPADGSRQPSFKTNLVSEDPSLPMPLGSGPHDDSKSLIVESAATIYDANGERVPCLTEGQNYEVQHTGNYTLTTKKVVEVATNRGSCGCPRPGQSARSVPVNVPPEIRDHLLSRKAKSTAINNDAAADDSEEEEVMANKRVKL